MVHNCSSMRSVTHYFPVVLCTSPHALCVSNGSPCQLMKYYLRRCACATDMEIHISGSDEDDDAFGRNDVSLKSEHLGHIRAIDNRASGGITVIQLTYFIGTDNGISWQIHKLEIDTCYRNWAVLAYDYAHTTFHLLITKCTYAPLC